MISTYAMERCMEAFSRGCRCIGQCESLLTLSWKFQVPELAGFWILTLLQAPLTVYLLANVNTIVLPLERAASIPLLSFLLAQLPLGFRALQLMVRAQAIKFHLSQFDSIQPQGEHLEMQEHRL